MTSPPRPGPSGSAGSPPGHAAGKELADEAWSCLLERASGVAAPVPGPASASPLMALYGPVLQRPAGQSYTVAHIGQSLDGCIATGNGASRYITGPADRIHNHRMRALFDAVLVGAGTVFHDDPSLTVRHVAGRHPVRVVIDTERSLGRHYRIFGEDDPPTILACAVDRVDGAAHGRAEVVGIARTGDGRLNLPVLLAALRRRGLAAVFVEGGGITVSRFLAAGCLDRLQITVAPLLLGQGRPGLSLPDAGHPDHALRPPTRHFPLGQDMLFDCVLRAD